MKTDKYVNVRTQTEIKEQYCSCNVLKWSSISSVSITVVVHDCINTFHLTFWQWYTTDSFLTFKHDRKGRIHKVLIAASRMCGPIKYENFLRRVGGLYGSFLSVRPSLSPIPVNDHGHERLIRGLRKHTMLQPCMPTLYVLLLLLLVIDLFFSYFKY